jgi:hypothetical protein
MKNTKPMLSVDPEVWKKVDDYAAAAGLKTANTLMAAAAVEFAKAAEKGLNVWHVLGRIAADDDEPKRAIPVARGSLMESR